MQEDRGHFTFGLLYPSTSVTVKVDAVICGDTRCHRVRSKLIIDKFVCSRPWRAGRLLFTIMFSIVLWELELFEFSNLQCDTYTTI